MSSVVNFVYIFQWNWKSFDDQFFIYGMCSWVLRSPFQLRGHKDIPPRFLLWALYFTFHIEVFNPSGVYLGIQCMVGISLYFSPYSELVFPTPATIQVIFSSLICGATFIIYKVPIFICGSGSKSSILSHWAIVYLLKCTRWIWGSSHSLPCCPLLYQLPGWHHLRLPGPYGLWTLLVMMANLTPSRKFGTGKLEYGDGWQLRQKPKGHFKSSHDGERPT